MSTKRTEGKNTTRMCTNQHPVFAWYAHTLTSLARLKKKQPTYFKFRKNKTKHTNFKFRKKKHNKKVKKKKKGWVSTAGFLGRTQGVFFPSLSLFRFFSGQRRVETHYYGSKAFGKTYTRKRDYLDDHDTERGSQIIRDEGRRGRDRQGKSLGRWPAVSPFEYSYGSGRFFKASSHWLEYFWSPTCGPINGRGHSATQRKILFNASR